MSAGPDGVGRNHSRFTGCTDSAVRGMVHWLSKPASLCQPTAQAGSRWQPHKKASPPAWPGPPRPGRKRRLQCPAPPSGTRRRWWSTWQGRQGGSVSDWHCAGARMRGCTASIMSASAWVGTQQLRAALCHQVCAPGRAAHFWPGCPSPESGVEERSQAEELEAGADEQVHGQEVEAWGEGGGGGSRRGPRFSACGGGAMQVCGGAATGLPELQRALRDLCRHGMWHASGGGMMRVSN